MTFLSSDTRRLVLQFLAKRAAPWTIINVNGSSITVRHQERQITPMLDKRMSERGKVTDIQ